jgi:predicted outer membrane protein
MRNLKWECTSVVTCRSLLHIALLSLGVLPLLAATGGGHDRVFLEQAVGCVHERALQATAHYLDSNLSVRSYAQKVMGDYSSADAALRDLARRNRVRLRSGPRLRGPSPFFANDSLWVQNEILGQRQAVAEFEKEARTTRDPRFRRLVAKFLPLLRTDVHLAEDVLASVAKRAVAYHPQGVQKVGP